MDGNHKNRKRGQSVIEFCIGLVALLTVVSGIFQLGLMGLGRTQARVEATAEAAERSMLPPDDTFRWIYSYVSEVTDGTDGRAYSMDDAEVTRGADDAYTQILEPNQSGFLRSFAPNNELAGISSVEDMQASMGMVRATAIEDDIPVMPIVRRLFFDQSSIDVEMEVWSVSTGGLY